MLHIFKRYFDEVRQARSDADISRILKRLSADFGCDSGYLLEYRENFAGIRRIIDSIPEREALWGIYFSHRLVVASAARDAIVTGIPLVRLDERRFAELPPETVRFLSENGLVNVVGVTISVDGSAIGLMGLTGTPELTPDQEAVLPLVAYNLFAQVHAIHGNDGNGHVGAVLTNREKEVIALSADGLTSVEIARRLGMSPRTVNQHVDNVAGKLGTKNRAHTVAEVIRQGLLD